jgi:hypothetical protein
MTPGQLQFAFALWTRAVVGELIRREFAVALSEVSVGRLLRKLGLSPQRPLYRAYQQSPQAVARWKAETYPQLRREAGQVGATIDFADEAGGRSDHHARDDLGADRPNPGGGDHGRPVRGQPDLGGDRQGQAALCRLRGQLERAGGHRFLPPAAG